MGIASHLGVLVDMPSILVDPRSGDEIIGKVIRTRERANPILISPGHKIGFDAALKYIQLCTKPNRRLPETTNLADKIASQRKLF